MIFRASILALLATTVKGACVGSETNVCMKINPYTSETGYYELDRGDSYTLSGPSPDITVKVGDV
eukprot:CAMPEP_0194355128 /NCGR_PEP_ID=MMETSP0174-20130528/3109_1 /TAXON_ID=216777 /ORGANISM="Proboscia alata, Strain PI-D3" /LENGTH=64 /DNA_ID=CAMNT_0039124305 /DNA_START=19 /DNA_END=209 /DNA_ORIENTATION=+